MKKIGSLFILLVAFMCMIASTDLVSAKSSLKRTDVRNLSDEVIGEVILYDDKTVEFNYQYRLDFPTVKVCKKEECDYIEAQIAPKQSFLNGQEAKYNLSEYLVSEEKDVVYVITATGNFKVEGSSVSFPCTLSYEMIIPGNDAGERNYDENDFEKSTENVKKVFNTWVIPGIYILLGVLIIIKGVLLAIDLVKYSDQPEIRREKLIGTAYLILAVFLAGIINTCVGVVTGLFFK